MSNKRQSKKSTRPARPPRRRETSESVIYRLSAATSMRRLREWVLCVLAGTMVFTSYPNFDLFYLQWFALIPLLWVIRSKRPGQAFIWGLWTGLVTNLGGFYWITGMLQDFGHFPLAAAIPLCVLLCAYQGLVPALWAAFTRWAVIRTGASVLWVAPVMWVVVEYSIPFVFPWYFANGQYLFYPAIQMVELTGVLGLSFLLVLVNTGLFRGLELAVQRRFTLAWRPVALVTALFALNIGYGLWRMSAVDDQMSASPTLRIGVGEANVGIFEKEARHLTSGNQRLWMLRGNIMKHHLLAAELEKNHHVDLIVEPESSFIPVPYPYGTVRFKRTDLFALAIDRDGRAWEKRDERWTGARSIATDVTLRAISAAREDYVVAVGDRGTLIERTDGQWTMAASITDHDLVAVWSGQFDPQFARVDGSPTLSVAVGAKGTALVNDGGEWQVTETGTELQLNGVFGRGHDDVLAVGAKGTILQWDGTKWSRQPTDTTVDLHAVHIGLSGKRIVVGDHGTVLVRKNGRWEKNKLGTGHLRAVASDGARLVIVGDRGALYEATLPDGKFRRVETGVSSALRSVSFDGWDFTWIVGDNGVVLQQGPGDPTWRRVSLDGANRLVGVAGVPFTEAHAYARDAKYVYRSNVPLPHVADRVGATDDINAVMPDDRDTPLHSWNTPLRGFDTPILLGLLTYEPKPGTISATLQGRGSRKTYNSALLVDGKGRIEGRYDKNYLLVFGEYIPLGETFPQFYEWLPEASHFQPGTTVETFEFKGFQIGVMICYEDIIPRFTRRLAGKNPNVLINVTNDAWFGKTSEPYLHLALAVFRAVENRLWLIRSTNTGVSAYVDAVGRIVAETRLEDPEVLAEDVPMMTTSTPYRSYGDLFTYACIVACLMLVVMAFVRRDGMAVA